MALVPFQQFVPKNGQYNLVERTYHRVCGGGYEKWSFEIDDQKYLFWGDVRELPIAKERVIYITLYKEELVNGVSTWSATWSPGSHLIPVMEALTDLAFRIQVLRGFRYITIHTCPDWDKPLKLFLTKMADLAPEEIKKEVYGIFTYDMQVSIDMGYADFMVGDIYTNPGFVQLNVFNDQSPV